MSPSPAAPIFILASERSGTNLLRTLLGNHSRIEAPVAPHFFDSWRGLLRHYGELGEPENMRRLLADMAAFANHSFNDWGIDLDVDRAMALYEPMNFLNACDVLYREKTRLAGRDVFVCKENHVFNYAFQIVHQWPEARFVYLYRDPRDQAASWKKNPLHLLTAYDSVKKWEHEQRICLELADVHGFSIHRVAYEDLITDPPRVMSALLTFCGLEPEEACFQTDPERNSKEAGRYVYWQNLDKPINRSNARKYAGILDPKEIVMVETLAEPMMRRLGYTFETKHDWVAPRFFGSRMKWQRKRVLWRQREQMAKDLALLRSKQAFLADLKAKASARAAATRAAQQV